MSTKHTPATPLPWVHINGSVVGQPAKRSGYSDKDRARDDSYRAHAANAYPKLVEALRDLMLRCDGEEGVRADGSNIQTMAASALLQSLGELE